MNSSARLTTALSVCLKAGKPRDPDPLHLPGHECAQCCHCRVARVPGPRVLWTPEAKIPVSEDPAQSQGVVWDRLSWPGALCWRPDDHPTGSFLQGSVTCGMQRCWFWGSMSSPRRRHPVGLAWWSTGLRSQSSEEPRLATWRTRGDGASLAHCLRPHVGLLRSRVPVASHLQ